MLLPLLAIRRIFDGESEKGCCVPAATRCFAKVLRE